MGGQYEESLLFLYKMRKAEHSADFFPRVLESSLVLETLLAAQHHNYAVTINIEGDDVSGFVQKIENGLVTLDIADSNGQHDGESMTDLSLIERIHVDDEDLQDLRMLSRRHDIEPSS